MLFWIGNSGKELFDKGDTHGFIRGYRAGFSDGWDESARQKSEDGAKPAYNTASLPCLCEDCTRRSIGSCRPNTNSRVTACDGYTKSQQAVA
jgi:hypothetical protein